MYRRGQFQAGRQRHAPGSEGGRRLGRPLHRILHDPSGDGPAGRHGLDPLRSWRCHQSSPHDRQRPQMGCAGRRRALPCRRPGQCLWPRATCRPPRINSQRHGSRRSIPTRRKTAISSASWPCMPRQPAGPSMPASTSSTSTARTALCPCRCCRPFTIAAPIAGVVPSRTGRGSGSQSSKPFARWRTASAPSPTASRSISCRVPRGSRSVRMACGSSSM